MIFKSFFGQSPKGGVINKDAEEERHLRDEIRSLFLISSEISAQKDLNKILELIARESLTSLKAHRSTIFSMDEKSRILKTQFTFSADSLNEQVGLFEEKEVTRKALKQQKPLLLREPKDFAEFFKYQERDRKITSLLSIPFSLQGKAIGAISAVLIDGGRRFDEGNLQLLSVFANHISFATEKDYLHEEIRKGINFRKEYERYLDDILGQLHGLSNEEKRRMEEHIGSLLSAVNAKDKQLSGVPSEERVGGINWPSALTGELDIHREQGEILDGILRVEIEGESLSITDDLVGSGLFIRTPNPLDLGEQFPMKLHFSPGEEPIEVTCKVIWTNKYGHETKDLRRGMGVKFLNIEPEIQKRVEDYLQAKRLRLNESLAMEKSA
ncbi:MAG: PilZ domain-containing protein [Thermodesulfobacteriota bacterium]|nr:PilZ domain-containing protein [Thermodesulfobacteriota bacterium]